MSTPESSPSPAPVGAIAALVFATLFYIGMVACLSDLHHPGQDAAGRGLAAGFAAIFGFLVWAFLGLLLLIAGIKGSMPFWAGIAVVILLPLSAIAAGIALDLTERGDAWLLIVPVALPPAFAAYGLWARLTGLHRALPETATSAAAVAVLTLLTLAPMPQYIARERDRAAVRVEQRAEEKAQHDAADRRHAEALARFQKLTADSPLSDWAVFFGNDSEFDRQAIDGARKLPHRQSDADRGLAPRRRISARRIFAARSRRDARILHRRPRLSAASGGHAPGGGRRPGAPGVFRRLYRARSRWLTKENCDLGAAVAAIDARGRAGLSPDGRVPRHARVAICATASRHVKIMAARSICIRPRSALARATTQFWVSRGDAYLDKLDYARAIPDYTEGIRLNPGYSAAYNARGYAYHAIGDDDHALAGFRPSDPAQRRSPPTPSSIGAASIRLGATRRGRSQDYDSALSLSPKFREALAGRGRARLLPGRIPAGRRRSRRRAGAQARATPPILCCGCTSPAPRSGQDARECPARDAAAVDRDRVALARRRRLSRADGAAATVLADVPTATTARNARPSSISAPRPRLTATQRPPATCCSGRFRPVLPTFIEAPGSQVRAGAAAPLTCQAF